MGIGASVFLIAVGAILAFALDYEVSGVDIAAIGWILMGVGALGIVVTLVIWAPRRTRRAPSRRPDDNRRFAEPDDEPYPGPSRGRGPAPAAYTRSGAGPDQGAGYRSNLAPGEVEYFAGVDGSGRERWVVGQIERREQRTDGEWLYVRPADPRSGPNGPAPAWVTAEHTRVLPRYDERR